VIALPFSGFKNRAAKQRARLALARVAELQRLW